MRRAEAHHTAGRTSSAALLLVDFFQKYTGAAGRRLHPHAVELIGPVKRLRASARRARVPVIYINDHLGLWRGNQEELLERAARGRGRPLVEALRPGPRDLFVLKPGRSGFFQSPLESLLGALGVRRLVVAGVATDVCVLSTVADAVIRKWSCQVPSDTTASLEPERHTAALALMVQTMDVDPRPSDRVRW